VTWEFPHGKTAGKVVMGTTIAVLQR